MSEKKIEKIKEDLEKIKKKIKKIEKEKMREVSLFRKISIFILTYIIVSLFFLINWNDKWYFESIAPTVLFMFYVMILDVIKNIWINKK